MRISPKIRSLILSCLLCPFAGSAQAATGAVSLVNGDFGQGTQGWGFWTTDTGAGSFIVEGGRARIAITVPGPNHWSVGISNPDIPMVRGRKYRVDFRAQSSPPINLSSEIHFHQAPWTSYSGVKVLPAGGTFQTFSYTFTMRQADDPRAAFQLMFGGQAPATVYFDDVTVTDLGPDGTEPVFPPGLTDAVVDKAMDHCTVFSFSQVLPAETAHQVFKVQPDVNIRTLMKFGTQGQKREEYDAAAAKYHHFGTLFMGGITSFISRGEFASEAEFLGMATRDAMGEVVPWEGLGFGSMFRGALANPAYRRYLVGTCKMQIDLGADGFHFDEANQSYVGGPARNWTGNEGFDDHSIADFNRYLLAKYPSYTRDRWKSRFLMADDNVIRTDVPADDLDRNFNYREYLQAHGWAGSTWGVDMPFVAANPLAAEWGRQEGNRIYNNGSFTDTYIRKYLKEIFDAARAYGLERYGKHLLITVNGIMPEVDYNSLGIYQPNRDDGLSGGDGFDYVPITGGRLNGSTSLMETYKTMYRRNRAAAGDVPLVFFLDWPNREINDYYALPVEQKKDFWRIYAAEAYAAGCYYAFHLSNVMPGEPTAEASGVLDFFTGYAAYYRARADLYHGNAYSSQNVRLSRSGIAFNLMDQAARGRLVLHLVNHHYAGGIQPQADFRAMVPVGQAPTRVYAVSPDFDGERDLAFDYAGGEVTVKVDSLRYYSVIVLDGSVRRADLKQAALN